MRPHHTRSQKDCGYRILSIVLHLREGRLGSRGESRSGGSNSNETDCGLHRDGSKVRIVRIIVEGIEGLNTHVTHQRTCSLSIYTIFGFEEFSYYC